MQFKKIKKDRKATLATVFPLELMDNCSAVKIKIKQISKMRSEILKQCCMVKFVVWFFNFYSMV